MKWVGDPRYREAWARKGSEEVRAEITGKPVKGPRLSELPVKLTGSIEGKEYPKDICVIEGWEKPVFSGI